MPWYKEIDLKAVVMGFLTDTVATIAVSFILVSAMSAFGISESEITDRMKTLSGLLLSLIFGLGCTVFGAYVAGRIAKRTEITHGAIVAGISLILALIIRDAGDPLWFEVTGYLCILPAGMLGGYFAAERRKRLQSGPK
jgi:hypothetical protein